MESLSLLHVNDIYNADKSARFVSQWKKAKQEEIDNGRTVLSFFSGDAWSPSIMSTIVRGKQMVPVLNALSLDAACLGNHDLDLGLVEFGILKSQCTFPWICSNCRHKDTSTPLGGCNEFIVLETKNENGPKAKFLVIGLVEEEWIDTLSTIEPQDVEYEGFVEYIKRRVPELVAEHQVDGVIAMSHMRMPNDYKLAEECGGYVDILLGGHDHHYESTIKNNIRILNSGTDFSDFTVVQLHGREETPREDSSVVLTHPLKTTDRRVAVDPKAGEEDPEIVDALKDIQEMMAASMDKIIGTTKVDLDARFKEIRTKETNISNFVANIMTRSTGAEVAILNSGSLRADKIIPKGSLTVGDMHDLLPMADPLAVIEMTAKGLLEALENGVSKYPAMEGRFPCVDGVRFSFAPSKPAGSRIVEESVFVFDKESQTFKPLDMDRKYSVVSKAYLLKGKDGYTSFVDAPVLIDDEMCPTLPITFRNLFTEISVLKRWEGMTVKATVIAAATIFKRNIRRSIADPYAISPVVDGRITNIEAEPAAAEAAE
ncbi:venom 5'-nucleotidase [Seminavis robusta]|uniref:Venom 5'-nucleotidase n=1 Tax=Seminavis robusta TaxID=568900 RepID=A0A9N8ED70_9STRA|nr:venom 5'-nucleotidase [Seminavis robusta]|eukprot:Sro905_g218580.1 venom 5'-nucleotidase (543) ;mRNA; r:35168-37244